MMQTIYNISMKQPESLDERPVHNIRPTLYIGLGGSGKEVLLRTRKMFFESYRKTGLPVVEYLWMDTDIRNVNITQSEINDPIMKKVLFSSDETCDMRVMPEKLNHIYTNFSMYPHIAEWFDRASLESVGGSTAIIHGAGQVRPFGRLAFYVHFEKIKKIIQNKLQKIQTVEAKEKTGRMGYRVDSLPEIVIVASVAGGTGSGTFIDTAFLCKYLAENAYISMVLFQPDVFTASGLVSGKLESKIKANGYAAMKELDNVMRPDVEGLGKVSNEKVFKWDGTAHSVSCPPAKTVYIQEYYNYAELPSESKTDVFQNVANSLYLDMAKGQFSDKKRSNRSNLEQLLTEPAIFVFGDITDTENEGIYRKNFPACYSSFGLASVSASRNRLTNAASYRLSQKIIGFWLGENNEKIDPRFENEIVRSADGTGFLKHAGLDKDEITARLLEENVNVSCHRATDENISKFFASVLSEINRYAQAGADVDDSRFIRFLDSVSLSMAEFRENLISGVRKDLGQYSSNGGLHLRLIERNREVVAEKLKDALEKKMVELLCSPGQYGPQYGNEMINILERHISECSGRIKTEITELKKTVANLTEKLGSNFDSKIDFEEFYRIQKVQQAVSQLESGFMFGLAGRMKKIAMDFMERKLAEISSDEASGVLGALENTVKEAKTVLSDWVKATYQLAAMTHTRQLLEDIESYIRYQNTDESTHAFGLGSMLSFYRESLSGLKEQFGRLYQSYAATESSTRNVSFAAYIRLDEAINKYTRKKFTLTEKHISIEEKASINFFESGTLLSEESRKEQKDLIAAGVREVFYRARNKNAAPAAWEDLERSLDIYCTGFFNDFLTDDINIIELMKSIQDFDLPGKIESMSALATPQFVASQYPVAFQYDKMLGLGVSDESFINEISNYLNSKFAEPSFELTDYKDTMLFYSEAAGFPLYSVKSIWDCKKEYDKELTNISIYQRHTDKSFVRLREILPPADEKEVNRQMMLYEPMLQGIICGKVKYNQKDGFHMFYATRYGIRSKGDLGFDYKLAEKLLYDSEEQKSVIRDAWLDLLNNMDDKPEKLKQLACVVRYTTEMVFPLIKVNDRVKVFNNRRSYLSRIIYPVLFRKILGAETKETEPDKLEAMINMNDASVQKIMDDLDITEKNIRNYTEVLSYEDIELAAPLLSYKG